MFNQELSNLKLNEKLKMKIYIFLKFKAFKILFQTSKNNKNHVK